MPAIGGGSSTSFGWADLSYTGELTSFGIRDGGSATMLFAIEVDGQILVDGVNSSYGANGFHLDFADPNDLGADRSGNGNDFTATGFNTDLPGMFSNGLTVLDGGTWSAGPANACLLYTSPSPRD